MTSATVHSTGTKVEVFPYEFKVILKAINHSVMSDEFDNDEIEMLLNFKDYFADEALNHGG